MKKLPLILLLCLFSCSAFGQNAFSIVQQAKNAKRFRAAVVCRELYAPAAQAALAKATVDLRLPRYAKVSHTNIRPNTHIRFPQVCIKSEFSIPLLANPNSIYGGYNYLKTVAKLSHTQNAVEPAYVRMWHLINDTNTFHGAHHIVNKSTLKIIFEDMQEKAWSLGRDLPFTLSEMQNNAPGIFHMLHGHPAYQRLFHNTERQLDIYYESGVKGILDDFFERLDQITISSGGDIPSPNPAAVEGTYKEAELWSKTFHLRWK